MVISFDFDDTLLQTVPDADLGVVEAGPNGPILSAMREHALAGDVIVIVSSRRPGERPGRTSVLDFVNAHGLPVSGIHFTSGADKVHTLKALGVSKHFDDDLEELRPLAAAGIEGVQVPLHPSWDSFNGWS